VGGGPGVKAAGLPLLGFVFVTIYIYIYNYVHFASLAMALELYPNDLTMARFGVVHKIWWTCQTIVFQFFFHGLSLSISCLPHGSL
jgi:hypothetical protein